MIYKEITICEKAVLTTYLHTPHNKKKKPALIICPGGGYIDTSTHEGECVALEYMSHGYQCFVLDYSTLKSNPNYCYYPQPLIELAKAMEMIKNNSDEWFVDTEKVFLLGFSAGGNLIANYGNQYEELSERLNISSHILKPTGLVVCYGAMNWEYTIEDFMNYKQVIDMRQITGENIQIPAGQLLVKQSSLALFQTETPSLEQIKAVSPYFHVNKKTPPTFMWHTVLDDMVSVRQTYEYVIKLNEYHIPHELHVFEQGHHGLSLANAMSSSKEKNINQNVNQWVSLALSWMNRYI